MSDKNIIKVYDPAAGEMKTGTANTKKEVLDKIDSLEQGLAEAGKVETVNSVKPDSKKNVELTGSNIKYKTGASENIGVKIDILNSFTNNPDAKNSIYRGKNLGSEVTEEQYKAISSGSFDDLYIGDYWRINNINWRIAAFNYYKNTGDTSLTKNHITIVPDTTLYSHKMNEENKTEGGYLNSLMYTEGLEEAKTTIKGIFREHLVNHRQILTNATADGKSSGWAWVDSEVELMNEIMVYGASVFGSGDLGGGSGRNIGTGKSQLPLFSLNPQLINTRQSIWLRDVMSAAYFAIVTNNGTATYRDAGVAYGVRPAFSIS